MSEGCGLYLGRRSYRAEPYPEQAAVEIAADEYRLLIIVNGDRSAGG